MTVVGYISNAALKRRRRLGRAARLALGGLLLAAFQMLAGAPHYASAFPSFATKQTQATSLVRGKRKRLVISPDTLTFNKIPAHTSENATVTVGNPNGVDAQIASIRPHGANFKIASNQCPCSLAPPATCTISVLFPPQTPGRKTGHL